MEVIGVISLVLHCGSSPDLCLILNRNNEEITRIRLQIKYYTGLYATKHGTNDNSS